MNSNNLSQDTPEIISENLKNAMMKIFHRCPQKTDNPEAGFETKIAWLVLYGEQYQWGPFYENILLKIKDTAIQKKLLVYLCEWIVHNKDPEFEKVQWGNDVNTIIKYIKERFPGRDGIGVIPETMPMDSIQTQVVGSGGILNRQDTRIQLSVETYGSKLKK